MAVQSYNDLYGKPLKHDWVEKPVFLILNGHKNYPIWRYNPKNLEAS